MILSSQKNELETPARNSSKEKAASLEGSDAHLNPQYYIWLTGQPSSSRRLGEEGGKWQHLAFVTEPWGPWNPSTHLKNGRPSDINRKRPLKSFMLFCSPSSGPSLPLLLLAFYKLWMRLGAAVPPVSSVVPLAPRACIVSFL